MSGHEIINADAALSIRVPCVLVSQPKPQPLYWYCFSIILLISSKEGWDIGHGATSSHGYLAIPCPNPVSQRAFRLGQWDTGSAA